MIPYSIISFSFSPLPPVDPRILVTSDIDIATIWNVSQNKLLLTLKLNEPLLNGDIHIPYVWGMSWAPNGKYLAMCYPRSPRVYIWDVQTTGASASLGTTRQEMLLFPDKALTNGATTSIAWSPDGRYIASGSGDSTVIVWKVDGS